MTCDPHEIVLSKRSSAVSSSIPGKSPPILAPFFDEPLTPHE